MSFFRAKNEIRTEDLKLKDYRSIWTKFCFLDETGSLNSGSERFFTVGVIKMSQPYYLQSKIQYERNKRNFYDEIKFNALSKNKVAFAKFVIDSFFDTKSISFYSYTISKQSEYFKKKFQADPWQAYEEITLKLLDASLSENEILILLADHVTVPKHIKFEKEIKKKFNASKKRLALAGVTRFDSKSQDLLQVVDLLIGAIAYDLKVAHGLVEGSAVKKEVVEYLKTNLGTDSFVSGFRNRDFNIFVDQTDQAIQSTNEKGPSS